MRFRFLLLPAAILGLAALAAAAPSHQRQQQQQQQRQQRPRHQPARDTRDSRTVAAPIRSDEFSLAMSVNGTYLALVAVTNDTSGDLILQAEVTGTSPGTPTYMNTTDTTGTGSFDSSLVLILADATGSCAPGAYGLSVPDVGEVYGANQNVFAVLGYQEFKFEVNDGTVFHQLTSGSQSWFSCEDALVGADAPGYFLRWGVFTNQGAAPPGCTVTSVVQDFNIAGGAAAAGRRVAV